MFFPFTTRRRILWGDSDPAGIVYTPRVFHYALETIEEWLIEMFGHTSMTLRDDLKIDTQTAMEFIGKANLPSRPFFFPLSSLPAYDEQKKYESVNLNAYDISSRGICLPCSLNLEEEQIEHYCKVLKTLLSR